MELFDISGIYWFLILLPFVAFMYAAVGHGGASGYLALMALFSFPTDVMKPTALLLNLFVAAIAFVSYYRKGYFNLKLFLSFAVLSIPLAFLGGTIEIDAGLYKKILAGLLVFAILRILNVFGKEHDEIKKVNLIQSSAIGGVVGLFSGLIGIGGGIILSPLILLMNWGRMKEAAAVSALFIWVNSAAGMAGQLYNGVTLEPWAFALVGIAVLGGFAGGYLGSTKFNNKGLKYMLAFVLFLACIKLIFT